MVLISLKVEILKKIDIKEIKSNLPDCTTLYVCVCDCILYKIKILVIKSLDRASSWNIINAK